jgi:hypothetical protein
MSLSGGYNMLIGIFVTCIVVTLSPHSGQASDRSTAHFGRPGAAPPRHAAPVAGAAPVRAEELYSLRARRRFASYLRLRLLEMREAGLERAAEAVQRRLPADALVP